MQIQELNLAKEDYYLAIYTQKCERLSVRFLFLKRPFSSNWDNNIYYNYFSKLKLTNTVFPKTTGHSDKCRYHYCHLLLQVEN